MQKRQSEQILVSKHLGLRRLRQMLSLLGCHRRGALIHNINGSSDTRLFLDPSVWLFASDLDQVVPALNQMDQLRQNHTLVGWFAYELAAALEKCLPERFDYGGSFLEFGVYQDSIEPPDETTQFLEGEHQISELVADTRRDLYVRSVQRILEQIWAGNVYQVNFTVRLKFAFRGDPRSLFLSLLRSQPVENACILRNEDHWILSLSPELFFRTSDHEIDVRPMKGTLTRGRTNEEDRFQSDRLQSNPKDRAENLMIVDLMRNDLGRISRFGSVSVDRLFEVHRLPTLFQMTSTVSSRLRDLSLQQLLKAMFPSGSVTGTPKLAAMKYINEMELSPRGIYCGAVGQISKEGSLFNVPIRTLTLRRRIRKGGRDIDGTYQGELGVGSGIVADSEPLKEWEESRLKSTFLLDRPPTFSLVETIRFERDWLRLSKHLIRLAASAEYFGFRYDQECLLNTLLACATSLGEGVFKVRLLLDERGHSSTEVEKTGPITEPVRIAFAKEQTDRNDRFLYHKTTYRPLYLRASKMAPRLGLWDLLFTNREGEVTEGAICNVFARINGTWNTPPQDSGLLAGIMREELIAKLKASIRPLHRHDLIDAEKLLVSNSIRGPLRAQLIDLPHANIQEL